ncbi:MAG: glycoside hydrolase family 38 C-terminal domain-containing protein, partial [Planctomycetota bacterium]
MYLKQENDRAQTWLERVMEPVAAYARFVHGRDYPQGLVDHAWKTLLANHPHDSICGCSTDEVHRDMEPRFRGVVETAEQSVADALAGLVPTFGRGPEDDRATALCVMNPLPERRTEVIERLVVLQPPGYDLDRLTLVDDADRPVEFEVTEQRILERFWGVDHRTELAGRRQLEKLETYLRECGDRILKTEAEADRHDTFLTLRILARDLPPLGHVVYRLVEGEGPADAPVGVTVDGSTIENEHLRVTLHPDGTFDVVDRAAGEEYRGLGRLEDTEDVGDEYDYSPAPESRTVTSEGCRDEVEVLAAGGLLGRLAVMYCLELPAAIAPDRARRLEETTPCWVRTVVGLSAGSRHVDVETTFVNGACDHRLRALFPAEVSTETLFSDGHFYVNARPFAPPEGRDWIQPPPETKPQQDF